tara:strand:- start:543 stop:719 length:177 start_codon:yes stop_codon:yes gene_type:complete
VGRRDNNMEYAYLRVEAPSAEPPKRPSENPYPDYEQSFIVQCTGEREEEKERVVVIQL